MPYDSDYYYTEMSVWLVSQQHPESLPWRSTLDLNNYLCALLKCITNCSVSLLTVY